MPLFVWMQHEGEDAEEAAIRVAVPEDAFVSDLVCAAAPFFAFGGARGMTLRASQIQLLGPKGDPLSNREKLSACGIEGGVTVRAAPAQDPPRDWAADFAEFYTLHKPEKLDSVPEKLQRHAGEEKALWAMLLQKYGLTEANWRTEKALPVADSPAVQPVAPPPGAAPDAHQDAADSGGYNQEY